MKSGGGLYGWAPRAAWSDGKLLISSRCIRYWREDSVEIRDLWRKHIPLPEKKKIRVKTNSDEEIFGFQVRLCFVQRGGVSSLLLLNIKAKLPGQEIISEKEGYEHKVADNLVDFES